MSTNFLFSTLNVWSVCFINSQLFEITTFIEWLCVQQTLSRPSVESQRSEIHAPATWTFLWLYVSMTIFELCSFDSGEFSLSQAKKELVRKQNLYSSYWAWSTPWGHFFLSLKTFCQIPVLSWAIGYSVFQFVKSASSFQKWASKFNSSSWHLVVKFGHYGWF